MEDFLTSNPFQSAAILILIVALIKIMFVLRNGNDSIDRLWRGVGGTLTSSAMLLLVSYTITRGTGMLAIYTFAVSVVVHLYINWTIGLWRDRRDRQYPYVFCSLREGKGFHFYRLMDNLSHFALLIWIVYPNVVTASFF